MPFSSRLLNTGSLQIDGANFDEISLDSGSVQFNGSTQYLSVPSNAAFGFGTGDLTLETWIYPTALGAFNGIVDFRNNNIHLLVKSNGAVEFGDGTLNFLTSAASTIAINNWYHIAVTRIAGATKMYVNGTLVVSATNQTASLTANTGLVGKTIDNRYFTGYISNVRIVNGTGIYTSNFVPPQAILSTTSITPGSIGLNGTNQFLSTPATGSLANNAFFGTGKTFTVEAWIYQTSTISTSGKFNIVLGDASGSTGSNMCWNVGTDSTNTPCIAWYDGSSKQATGSTPLTTNTWNHVAWVSTAGTVTIYVNGVSQSLTGTTTLTNSTQTAGIVVGVDRNSYWGGRITNLRATTTAVYTGNFTPPTAPLVPISGTILLLLANSANTLVTDSSSSPFTITNNNTATFVSSTGFATPVNTTSLLLNVTDSTNFIKDNSPNNFTLTNTGTATWIGVGPFNLTGTPPAQRSTADGKSYQVSTQVDDTTLTSGSVQFNGSTQYLSLANDTSNQMGTGDWTAEAWIYITSYTLLNSVWAKGGTTTDWFVGTRASTGVLYCGIGTTDYFATTGPVVSLNVWHHIALVRSGTTLSTYLDGVLGNTLTGVTQNFASTGELRLGRGRDTSTNYLTGYISSARLVKGTAVYTAAFTPPQFILPAINGTSLLLNAVNSDQLVTDGSPNNFTVTNNGTATWSPTNPFNFGGGGSISFNGTSQYLTVTSPGTAFSMGTGDFTIEAWIYNTSTAATSKQIFSNWASGANSYQFYLRTNNRLVWQIFSQSSPDVASLAVTPNTWTHVAWSKSGTVAYLFINGVLSDTTTGVTLSANGTAGPYVGGQGAAELFPGYITNLRVIKGVALYTSSFTPPRQTLKAVSGTSLLLNVLNATNFIKDSSTNNFTMTNTGTATYSSTVAPGLGAPALRSISEGTTETLSDLDEATLSSGSIAFNATSYLNPGSNAAFAFGTGNFTIECWFYAFYIGNNMTLLDTRNPDTSNAGWDLTVQSNGKMLFGTNSVAYINNGTTTLAANTWYYISVVRDSTTQIRMFLNGVQEGSTYTASATQNFTNTAFQIGTGANGTTNGLITNVRLTKGVALNVQTTPFQSMLTATANTSILLNVVNSTNFIKDGSPTNATVTNPAATLATWVNSSPFNQGINGGAINFAQPGGGATVQYLISPASSNLNLGSSNFTAEGWFLSSPYQFDSLNNIIGFRSTSYPFGPFFLCLSSTSTLNLYSSSNGTTWNLANAVSLGTINIGTWNHIALVRNGNSMQAYVNGVATGSAINTTSVTFSQTSAPFTIGGNNYLSNDQFAGLITNVRLVIGTAIYTANFTVPTAPLTAVSGTQLLLSANTSGTVATDSSTNNFSMTNTGSVGWIGTGPFNGQ